LKRKSIEIILEKCIKKEKSLLQNSTSTMVDSEIISSFEISSFIHKLVIWHAVDFWPVLAHQSLIGIF